MTPLQFAELVMMYCAQVEGSVSSWGRTWWYNRLVGGVEFSGHRFWCGADVRCWDHLTGDEKVRVRRLLKDDDFAPAIFDLAARKKIAERLGLFLFAEDDHDHLQPLVWPKG